LSANAGRLLLKLESLMAAKDIPVSSPKAQSAANEPQRHKDTEKRSLRNS